jgi:hypothetical protein
MVSVDALYQHTRRLAAPTFNNPDLSIAAGSILGGEAMHWAILRQALGESGRWSADSGGGRCQSG